MSDQSTPTLPFQSRAFIVFPLTRKASIFKQILGMTLYTLFMALSLAASQFLSYLIGFGKDPNNTMHWVLTLALLAWVFIILLPAATALCGALFGSWRGALVSFFSIGGMQILVYLLNSHFPHFEDYLNSTNSNLQLYLIPGTIAALIVGVIYDFRQYESWEKSTLTLLLGVTIAHFGFAILSLLHVDDPSPFVCCFYLFIVLFSAFLMLGIEQVLQQILSARKTLLDREQKEGH